MVWVESGALRILLIASVALPSAGCGAPRFEPSGEPADHLQRAGDGVAGALRPARVARAAMHRDGDVDAAAVAEADAVAGAVEDRHLGAHAGRLDDAADRVVTAGLARDAAEEHHLSGDAEFSRRGWIAARGGSRRAAPSVRSGPCPAPPRPAGRIDAPSRTSPPYGLGMVAGGWVIALVTSISERPLSLRPSVEQRLPMASRRISVTPISRSRGSTALSMKARSCGSASNSSVSGLGTRTSSTIRRLGALRRDQRQHGVEIGRHGGGYAFAPP